MRKVKDAVDLSTNDKIYFKCHAKATYLSDGRNVEEALGVVATSVGNKQDTIEDLETIRSGAALGATALQSVPSTYATKTDLATAIQTAITSTLNTEV